MKKLLTYIFTLNLKALLVEKTDDTLIQAFRYIFVGGAAFVADAGSLWLISLTGIHYLICTAIAFCIGLAANYALSKRFVFTENAKTGRAAEFVVYAVIGIIGLGLTELLMFMFTDLFGMYFILSKVVAAVLVLAWNFIARKLFLYRRGKPAVETKEVRVL